MSAKNEKKILTIKNKLNNKKTILMFKGNDYIIDVNRKCIPNILNPNSKILNNYFQITRPEILMTVSLPREALLYMRDDNNIIEKQNSVYDSIECLPTLDMIIVFSDQLYEFNIEDTNVSPNVLKLMEEMERGS